MSFLIKSSVCVCLLLLLLSCNNKNNELLNSTPPLEVVVPQSLKNHVIVVEWIKETEKALNSFNTTIQQILKGNQKIINKGKEKMTMREKIQFMAISGQLTLSFTEFHQYFDVQKIKKDSILTGLSDDQATEFIDIYSAFDKRIEYLDKKFLMIQEKQ